MRLSFLFGTRRTSHSERRAGRPSAARRVIRPRVETLEERCVLSADPGHAVTPAPDLDPLGLVQVRALLQAPKGNPRVVFLGDSIFQFFADGVGSPVWRERIAPLGAEDLAARGNATENLLYELNQGLLGSVHPRLIVLMIGVNNLREGDTPEQTAAGVVACLAEVRSLQPQARVLLLGLLPAGQSASDPLRAGVSRTNFLLAGLADGNAVRYADVGGPFVGRDGNFAPGLMLDDFHPSREGYRSIADSLASTLSELSRRP